VITVAIILLICTLCSCFMFHNSLYARNCKLFKNHCTQNILHMHIWGTLQCLEYSFGLFVANEPRKCKVLNLAINYEHCHVMNCSVHSNCSFCCTYITAGCSLGTIASHVREFFACCLMRRTQVDCSYCCTFI